MFSSPTRPEIDHRTIKLVVGLIALLLAPLTSFFAHTSITSISAAYYDSGWSQNIFVGFLFAIAAFLLAYNGESTREMILSKVAACAAFVVAMSPCECVTHAEVVPYVHGVAASIMFVILAFFCLEFFKRARAKGHPEAMRRAGIYAVCGVTIVAAIVLLAVDHLSGGFFHEKINRFVFWGESAGLSAFGVSWLTASRILPVITSTQERFSPFS